MESWLDTLEAVREAQRQLSLATTSNAQAHEDIVRWQSRSTERFAYLIDRMEEQVVLIDQVLSAVCAALILIEAGLPFKTQQAEVIPLPLKVVS